MTQAISASDKTIIGQLSDICKFHYKMEEEHCTEISFHDEASLFGGTIRRHPQKKQIIESVARLPYLKHLNIRKCKIKEMPEIRSRSLEYLDISCNDIESIPSWVVSQPQLKFLSLGANKLIEVPDLSSLPLETLKLHKNRIKQMPEVGDKIKSLNLFLNPMLGIPERVLSLSLLEVFSFGVTETKTLPSLSSLPNLRWLTLTVNHIESLPDDICQLDKMEGLTLAKNKLKRLPSRIGEMNLKSLTLYSNNIAELPESFFGLKLNKLNLARNPLKNAKKAFDTFSHIEFLRMT